MRLTMCALPTDSIYHCAVSNDNYKRSFVRPIDHTCVLQVVVVAWGESQVLISDHLKSCFMLAPYHYFCASASTSCRTDEYDVASQSLCVCHRRDASK